MIVHARPQSLLKTACLVVALATVMPSAASAHMMFNTSEFYGAAAHPWVNLNSSLLLITVCLWLAQWFPLGDPIPLISFSAALITGAAAGAFLHLPLFLPAPGYGLAMLAGLLVAGKIKIGRTGSLAIVFVLCFYAGLSAGADAAGYVRSPFLFMCGITLGATIIPLLITGMLVDRKSPLVVVGIRIIGSWVAAIGLMLVAFSLRKTFHGGV